MITTSQHGTCGIGMNTEHYLTLSYLYVENCQSLFFQGFQVHTLNQTTATTKQFTQFNPRMI